VAYFKLHGKRGFDQTDLLFLAETGRLTMDDVSEIKNILEQEFENRKVAASIIIERVAPTISKESAAEEIFDTLMQDEDIAGRIREEEDKERIRKLAKLIAKQDDKSPENIKRVVIEASGIENDIAEQREKLNDIETKNERC